MKIKRFASAVPLLFLMACDAPDPPYRAKINTHQPGISALDSGVDIVETCEKRHVTCMVDFTSHDRCMDKQTGNDLLISDIGKYLDLVVAKCPIYKWSKQGVVYVIEPRAKSDSVLNVQIAGFRQTLAAQDAIELLSQASGLSKPRKGFFDLDGGTPDRKIPLDLPATTLKASLIEAARQSQPSFWMVHYIKTGTGLDQLEFSASAYEPPQSSK